MKIPEINIQNSVNIPILGLGTWEMGGRENPDFSRDKHWMQAIEAALELGIRHIDTAERYGGGHCEELLGAACKGVPREKLFITTKVSGENLRYERVLRSAENSLKRLQTDYIDLYLLHWPNPAIPVSETMRAIHHLIGQGLIRHIGLSNYTVPEMLDVMAHTDQEIITNQLEYNLLTRNNGRFTPKVEQDIMPFCLRHGISITAWRPVVKGDTAGLQRPEVMQLAKKYDKTPVQIALNWLFSKPLMLTVPKMSSRQHIIENIEALHFSMEDEEYTMLDGMR